MKPRFLVLYLAVLFPLLSYAAEQTPAIAIFIEAHDLVAPGAERKSGLIVAIWPNGRIVWSRDQQGGGTPYFTARVDRRSVQAVLDRVEGERVFDSRSFRHSWFGPDSTFTTIWLQSGARHTRLQSWHEGFEQRPTLVALSTGVTTLDGVTREEALRRDTKEYQRFRRIWADLRAGVSALVPRHGQPYNGSTELTLPK